MRTTLLLRTTRKLAATLWLMTITAAPAQTAVEAWVQRYSHPTDSNDAVRKMAIDNAGNVIVATYTDQGINGQDFLVLKYSGAGVLLWTNRYSGSGDRVDFATGVAVDHNDNVFVTGYSDVGGFDYDFATVAYSAAGTPLWTNRYDGPANSGDRATAIAVDASGNVFVTGSSGSSSNLDYATVAYSGAGVPLWTNRYDDPEDHEWGGEDFELPAAIAVNSSGNVFVTGSSFYDRGRSGYGYDYATVGYSGSGVPLWTNRFMWGDAHAIALAVDNTDKVFVTGSSYFGGATVAYSETGVPLWTNRIPTGRADAIAVDGSGNVFVTGNRVAVAYSGTGVPLWTNRYTGPGDDDAIAVAVAVDVSGNVFVTGYSTSEFGGYDYATVAYSGSGMPLWTNRYDGPANSRDQPTALALDGNGNVVVTGNSGGYCTTVKYSGAGAPSWTNRYYLPGNDGDYAKAIVVNSTGKVFVTGQSFNGYSMDYATVAYSSAGLPLWSNRYNGPADSGAGAMAMAADTSGNVYVTGYIDGGGGYATIAFSESGVPLWTSVYNAGNGAIPVAIASDEHGKVFVTGHSGPYPNFDFATVAYSIAGVPLWTNRYNGPGNRMDAPTALGVDRDGNVFVSGYSARMSDYPYNYYCVTIKYSGGGIPFWTNRYSGSTTNDDQPKALAVDGSGNVFVTGQSHGIGGGYVTVAYSGAGLPLWTNRYDSPSPGTGGATAIAVDSSGNVFVTGNSSDGYESGYATIKYSGAGVPLWTNWYNSGGEAVALIVNRYGDVIVTGYSYDPLNWLDGGDYATVAYSSTGVPLWTNRYQGPMKGDDRPAAIAVDKYGDVFITGWSAGSAGSPDYLTIKYSVVPAPIPLDYQIIGSQLVLSWTNAAFSLQSAPTAHGTYTNIPGATSPYTTALSGLQRYFRLTTSD